MRPYDTTLEAHAVQRARWQAMTGEERVLEAMQMAEDCKAIALVGIRHRHPDLGEHGVNREWLRLLHGDVVAEALV